MNLDFERPHFEGMDIHRLLEPNNDENRAVHIKTVGNITYEELQRKNREKYALKYAKYY